MLHAQAYFDGDHPDEAEIRGQVDAIYWRIDWKWAQVRGEFVSMGWKPGVGASSRTTGRATTRRCSWCCSRSDRPPTRRRGGLDRLDEQLQGAWGRFMGYEHLSFAPLFGHQYSHSVDRLPRHSGRDHARARHRLFREHAPRRLRAAGLRHRQSEGLVRVRRQRLGLHRVRRPGQDAPDRPHAGARATFSTTRRAAPAAAHTLDDGTIAPTAAISCLPFAPEIAIPATEEMHSRYGQYIYSRYGFFDSFNRSFTATDVALSDGRVDPSFGWIAKDYLGIDQGPILAMICNYRNQLVWDDMRKCAPLRRGLARAGFTGGWLDQDA